MPLILPPKSRKMHLRESAFSKFPGGACPRTPLGIACQRHARMRLRPKYPPIIARFPPVKNFSYIPAYMKFTDSEVHMYPFLTRDDKQLHRNLIEVQSAGNLKTMLANCRPIHTHTGWPPSIVPK